MPDIKLFKILTDVASQIFAYGISLNIQRDINDNKIRLKLKDFMIKDNESSGIIVEDLVLDVVNLTDSKKPDENFKEASYIFDYFSVLLSEDWLNGVIQSNIAELKKNGVESLRIAFKPGKLTIAGSYKRGITFPFSIDFKISTKLGKIIVTFDRFWAADMVPLPQLFQKTLFSYLQRYMESHDLLVKGVKLHQHYVLIDPEKMLPIDARINFEKFRIFDKYLSIQGGANFEECMKEIQKERNKENVKEIISKEQSMKSAPAATEKKAEKSEISVQKKTGLDEAQFHDSINDKFEKIRNKIQVISIDGNGKAVQRK